MKIKRYSKLILCFTIITLLITTTAFGLDETLDYSFLSFNADYGTRGFGYSVHITESYDTMDTTANLNYHYLRLYSYDWQNPLGGSAGLWNTKYYSVSSSKTLLGTLYSSDYSYEHDIILPGDQTTYLMGENRTNFSHYYRNGSNVFVSTYFSLDSSWTPGIKTFEDELVIRY
ncbi:MAG: hypothetical protein PWP27_1951 [Clostridiales bacterium]|nr:hypothetical protein [Clostridiales bacterium]MDK2934141.1 hypothetical protein [Clostridiales bacterium]